LVMVKVSVVPGLPTGMLAALNALEMAGGATVDTVRLVEAVLPVPPSFEVTALVILSFIPPDVPVALTENVHEAPAANVPPERLILSDPGTAATAPPHDPVNPFGVATTSPAGSVSVKPTPVRGKRSACAAPVKVSVGAQTVTPATKIGALISKEFSTSTSSKNGVSGGVTATVPAKVQV